MATAAAAVACDRFILSSYIYVYVYIRIYSYMLSHGASVQKSTLGHWGIEEFHVCSLQTWLCGRTEGPDSLTYRR